MSPLHDCHGNAPFGSPSRETIVGHITQMTALASILLDPIFFQQVHSFSDCSQPMSVYDKCTKTGQSL